MGCKSIVTSLTPLQDTSRPQRGELWQLLSPDICCVVLVTNNFNKRDGGVFAGVVINCSKEESWVVGQYNETFDCARFFFYKGNVALTQD